MKKICLFSAKAIKGIEGEEAELYVNFYLALSKDYAFTFLIDTPNLACSDRHPIKLWKRFLILLEEEYVKYMRRYEEAISNRKQGITTEEDEALNIWEHSKGVIEVLTSYPMGAWLHRRDKRVINDILKKIRAEIEREYTKFRNRSDMWSERACGLGQALEIIDKYRAESEVTE